MIFSVQVQVMAMAMAMAIIMPMPIKLQKTRIELAQIKNCYQGNINTIALQTDLESFNQFKSV